MEPRLKLIEVVNSEAVHATDPPEIDGYERGAADWRIPRLHRVSVPDDSIRRVVDALQAIAPIASLEGGVCHYSPSSTSSISLEQIAHWALAQARFRPAETCIDDLLGLVLRNSSPLLEIVPIWGIAPKKPINLGNGINIVPTASLPESKLKDLFIGKKRHRFSFDIANGAPRPGAAIVKESIHGPIYEALSSKAAAQSRQRSGLMLRAVMAPTEDARQEAMIKLSAMMGQIHSDTGSESISAIAEELANVVALCTPKPIFPIGHWYQRPETLPLVGTLGGYSGPTNDHPFYIAIDPQDYPVDEIEQLVRQYIALSEQTRRRLQTPLKRLNQGRRQLEHHTVEGAAIELGIAAEALLTQDRDRDAPISFTLRARGTVLMGGTPEERKHNYETLRNLYDLRSTVAHEGSIIEHAGRPRSKKDQARVRKAHETVTAGQQLCTSLIRRVIDLGSVPSWDALMFGW